MSKPTEFKYGPMHPKKVQLILEAYKHEQIYDYIMELYELINYQKEMINEQRIEIIGLKHKEAWKRYDRPLEEYDSQQRKYVDKPEKCDNFSC
jgi:hypothetical protein